MKNYTVNSEERKIYWLASYPKSGNTWIRMFLNAYVTKFPVDMNSPYQFVTSDIRPEVYQMMSPRPLTEMSIREQFMYHPGALINLIKLSNSKHVYVKTHNAKAVIDGITLIPSTITAKAVYIIRDPRDVVISMSHHFSKSINETIKDLNDESRAGLNEHNLYHMFMSWKSHVESWTTKNKDIPVVEIKYEDLLQDPIPHFIEIIKAFDLHFDREAFDFALKETTFTKLQEFEKKHGFVEQAGNEPFFRIGKSSQWVRILTKAQVKEIEHKNKEVMEYYGYNLVS